jgi:hypothetical protein
MKRSLVLMLLLVAAGCGGNSSTSPSSAQVGGVWRGTSVISASGGGECLASTFQSLIGSSSVVTASVTQSGSALSATVTAASGGGNCNYTGSVGQSAVVLNATGCSASDIIGARCPNGAGARDIRLVTAGVSGTVSGNSMTGTESDTYNVLVSGTGTGLGTLLIQTNFSLTRQ